MARDRDDDRDDRDDDRPRRRDRDDDDRPRRDRDDDRPRRRDDEDRPRRRDRRDDGPPAKQASVLGILALIGGIPSVLVNFIPCCGWVAGTVGGLVALTLGIIGLVQANGSNGRIGKGLPLAGTILGGAAVLISILWVIFFTVIAATAPTTPGGSTGTPISPSDPIAASVPAAALVQEFKDNEPAADVKYKGKVIEVTGRVKQVNDFGGVSDISVELDGVNLASVDCNFSSNQRAAVSGLTTGSTVTVRGRCAGLVVFDVALNDCIVMTGGPSQPSGTTPTGTKPTGATPTGTKPTGTTATGPKPGAGAGAIKLTTAELAKAFDDDEDAAHQKYMGKVVEVSGAVYKLDTDEPEVWYVTLGKEKMVVECQFKMDAPGVRALKLKAAVTIRGKCVGIEGGLFVLKDCTLVK